MGLRKSALTLQYDIAVITSTSYYNYEENLIRHYNFYELLIHKCINTSEKL